MLRFQMMVGLTNASPTTKSFLNMNTKLCFSLGLFFCLLTASVSVQGQTTSKDLLQAFKSELVITPVSKGFNIGMPPYFHLHKSSPKMKMPTVPIPKEQRSAGTLKTSTRPIVLQHEKSCYQFSCEKKGGNIIWWDRNGDGKVQAKRELRCVNEAGKPCEMVVEQGNCR